MAFRSEEHVGSVRGAVVGVEACWRAAREWFPRVVERGWPHGDLAWMQSVFDRTGLTGPFWKVL